MPCSHSSDSGDGKPPSERGIPRRNFLKTAVAIGGTNALYACLDRESNTESPEGKPETYQELASNQEGLPERQHSFGKYLVTDPHGNTVLPIHHVLLLMDYKGNIPPTADERRQVEKSLHTLERAFQWGVGNNVNAVLNKGLLFAMGYSPFYFDKYEEDLHDSVGLSKPQHVLEELGEDPELADNYDAFIYLTSGLAKVVLGAEEALKGNIDEVNGVKVEQDISNLFEIKDRRTGFVGQSVATERDPGDHDIPESAPLFMGFKSGYTDNLPQEDLITIKDGPFSQGTTAQNSQLTMDLDNWYELEHEEKIHRMYSPDHTDEMVGEAGHDLASTSGLTPDMVDNLKDDAENEGVVGHSQKMGKARDENFVPKVLRRDFDTTHNDEPGLAFIGFQEKIEDFIEMRDAMNGDDLDIDKESNGILDFIEVKSRATYLVPPRKLRALPPPDPDDEELL